MIKALCLGDKGELSSATRELFAETGTMHLLAVSGLHTGAVWLLLTYIFKIVGLSGKKSQLFLLPILWAYACITGLSPSVVRAAHILTFLTISHAFSKDYSALNSIAASAFVTLIFNPYALYSVSMQMSYAAYTGIVCIYPLLKKIFFSFSRFSLPLCVTLSAQIATLPLSAYYFHSISINSFIVNLLAIPLTTVLLYGGLLLLLFPGCISTLFVWPVQSLCKILTYLLTLFNKINWQANHLYPTFLHILILYGLIFFIFAYFLQRKKHYLQLSISAIVVLCGYCCLHNAILRNKKEIIIFHSYPGSCILLKQAGYGIFLKNTLHSASGSIPVSYAQKNKFQLLPEVPDFLHPQIRFREKQFQCANDTIYIIDTPHAFPSGGIWIITKNTFPRMLEKSTFQLPNLIILDASNKRSCIKQWENICQQQHIPMRTTWDEGNIHLPLCPKKRSGKMLK